MAVRPGSRLRAMPRRLAPRHGVRTRPVCVLRSAWRCTLEKDNSVRLGFCVVNGLNRQRAEALLQAQAERPFGSLADLLSRVPLDRDEGCTLAALGAFNGFGRHRCDALWQVEQPVADEPDLFNRDDARASLPSPLLPMDAGERLQADFDG